MAPRRSTAAARSSSRPSSANNTPSTAAASRSTRASRAVAVAATPTPAVKSLRLRQRRNTEPEPEPEPELLSSPKLDSDEAMGDGDDDENENDEERQQSSERSDDAEDEEEEGEEEGEEGGDEEEEEIKSEESADADDGPTTGQTLNSPAADDRADSAEAIALDSTSTPFTPSTQSLPLRGRGSRGRRARGGRAGIEWGSARSPAVGTGDEGSEAVVTPVFKRRRGRPPVNGVSSGTPRSARGGFRGRPRGARGSHSQVTRHPIDKEGNTLEIANDEVVAPPDEEGETKVDINGHLLGGREYRVRTFTLAGRGERLYMLSTEPARCTGFRDSYLFFTKHMRLFKIVIDEFEKHDLIDREVIPHSYKGRAIGVVTARSVFKEFGSKIVVGGKRITDDYYVQAARERGDVEGELADPFDRLPPEGQPYNQNQYVAWHGASQVYHDRQQANIPGGNAPGIVAGLTGRRKPIINSSNWMLEHALAASRCNSQLVQARRATHDGVYDPHTNSMHFPRAMQPTRARWEYVSPSAGAVAGTKRSYAVLINGALTPPSSSHSQSEGEVAGIEPSVSNGGNGKRVVPAGRVSSDKTTRIGDTNEEEEDDNDEAAVDDDYDTERAAKRLKETPYRTDKTIFPIPSRLLANNFLVVDTHLVTAPTSLSRGSMPNDDVSQVGMESADGGFKTTLPDPNDPAYADLPDDCRRELEQAIRKQRFEHFAWLDGRFATL